MKVEHMASILQELYSVKTDVAQLRKVWREEKLDQEDGEVPLPAIPEQPKIIEEASRVQESEATTQESGTGRILATCTKGRLSQVQPKTLQ